MNILLIAKNYTGTYGNSFDEYNLLDFIIENELEKYTMSTSAKTESARSVFERDIDKCLARKWIAYVSDDASESEELSQEDGLMYITQHVYSRAMRFMLKSSAPRVSFVIFSIKFQYCSQKNVLTF